MSVLSLYQESAAVQMIPGDSADDCQALNGDQLDYGVQRNEEPRAAIAASGSAACCGVPAGSRMPSGQAWTACRSIPTVLKNGSGRSGERSEAKAGPPGGC